MSALLDLADRCEKATGPDRTLEQDIYDALLGRDFLENIFQTDGSRIARYTASLDAARTLVPKGWALNGAYESAPNGECYVTLCKTNVGNVHSQAATLALALCAAALKSRTAQVGRNAKRQDNVDWLGPKDEHAVSQSEMRPNSNSTQKACE